MKEPWGSTHQKGGSRRAPCRSPDAESNDPTWPATIITTPWRPTESEERIQMDPIWIRRHPRPPVRPTQPPPHDTQVATVAPRTTPMGDPPAAPPDPTFLWIPLSRASQDGEDGEKPRRRPAGQASSGGAMDGGEEGRGGDSKAHFGHYIRLLVIIWSLSIIIKRHIYWPYS